MKKLKKSILFPRLPKSDDAPFNHEVNLTDLDKIYLLLAEENLKDSFNVLCYDLQIHSLADLSKLDDEKLKRFRLLPNFAKDRLRQLPEKAKTTDFVYLAKKHGKLPYKAQLESHGVPFISVNDIQVIKKTATGPVSGTVLKAIWTKPDGEKIQVALRYDRGQSQRKHFLHEAELATSLNHENILHLYGVVLPGLYTDSVALVTDFAKYGNILEARSHLIMSVVNVIQMITQIASALEYLGSKDLVHLRLNSASIFVVAPGKIKMGGLWGCFRRDQMDELVNML